MSADGRKATWEVDLSNPTELPLTSKSKSHLAASSGWVTDETTGLRYNLVVVLPFERAAELAALQGAESDADATADAGEAEAAPAAPVAARKRTRTAKTA